MWQKKWPFLGLLELYRRTRLSAEGSFIAALPPWGLFIMGWLRGKQIHCVTDKDLGDEQQLILTSL